MKLNYKNMENESPEEKKIPEFKEGTCIHCGVTCQFVSNIAGLCLPCILDDKEFK